jgi:hypothetical protein
MGGGTPADALRGQQDHLTRWGAFQAGPGTTRGTLVSLRVTLMASPIRTSRDRCAGGRNLAIKGLSGGFPGRGLVPCGGRVESPLVGHIWSRDERWSRLDHLCNSCAIRKSRRRFEQARESNRLRSQALGSSLRRWSRISKAPSGSDILLCKLIRPISVRCRHRRHSLTP